MHMHMLCICLGGGGLAWVKIFLYLYIAWSKWIARNVSVITKPPADFALDFNLEIIRRHCIRGFCHLNLEKNLFEKLKLVFHDINNLDPPLHDFSVLLGTLLAEFNKCFWIHIFSHFYTSGANVFIIFLLNICFVCLCVCVFFVSYRDRDSCRKYFVYLGNARIP